MTRQFLLFFVGTDSNNSMQMGNYYGSTDGALTSKVIEAFKSDWTTQLGETNNCYFSPEKCSCVSVIPLEATDG
jgi:hypothetical protein